MGLRKDFLMHKRRTIESFKFVKDDISAVDSGIDSLRNMLSSSDLRISNAENELLSLRKSMEQVSSEINMQRNHNISLNSKIEHISKAVVDTHNTLKSLNDGVGNLISKQQQVSQDVSGNRNAIKKLFSVAKAQSLRNRQLSSALIKYQKEIKKIKNLLKRNSKSVKRADSELERKLRGQKSRIAQLNRKIEGKKALRKTVRRATGAAPKRKPAKKAPKKKLVEIVTTKKSLI